MKVKPGAEIRGLQPVMRHALLVADRLWWRYGQELVVTSGLDGNHSDWSWHYYGCAVDLRTRYFSSAVVPLLAAELREELPLPFQVVIEGTHIHVEYDMNLEAS